MSIWTNLVTKDCGQELGTGGWVQVCLPVCYCRICDFTTGTQLKYCEGA
jgi:hypothetical protein